MFRILTMYPIYIYIYIYDGKYSEIPYFLNAFLHYDDFFLK
jgi:hypothetical protein